MGKKGRIAIITEGKEREPRYFEVLKALFFPNTDIDVLCLPTGGTIYKLWKRLKEDDLETDLIEVVRECGAGAAELLEDKSRDDFQEVYLFYDLDPQHNHLSPTKDPDTETVLRDMMKTFNNETELGKLYISYPMVEALRDVKEWSCQPYHLCKVPLAEVMGSLYKGNTGNGNRWADVGQYKEETWSMIAAIFLTRCNCLFHFASPQERLYIWYKEKLSPEAILEKQLKVLQKENAVFVLSAFPEWLLDYFRADRWAALPECLSRIKQPDCGTVEAGV